MIVGALLGGGASAATQWKSHQQGKVDTNQMIAKVATDAVKTGVISGASTYVAEKMAGRPLLSMVTILSAGAAGLYMMEQMKDKQDNET